ncbi:enoyl-CoA hydratase-related protein [Ferrimicrobium sp.]|uniref:enoyl-CoA hydratase-related protein n=1 Tax=Ferrimicrobium sp. TaxID=2926050 RepID=UPI00261B8C60|nr:enoyl-CoA hydratase-related protein [Ferrimicrobium sp.]
METLEIEIRDGIGELILNRPAKLNAMNASFFAELPEAIKMLETDTAVRVIVVRAHGPHFSAGLDLSEMTPGSQNIQSIKDIEPLQRGFFALATTYKPTLAAVNGYCIGGGLDLVAACDLRLATRSAIFSLREVRIGIVADLGSLALLSRVLPQAVLTEIALTGRDIDATEALRIGLVQSVSETPEDLDRTVFALGQQIQANPPLAVQATKRLLVQRRSQELAQHLELAASYNVSLMQSNDMREALSAMRERRIPTYHAN